VDFFRNSGNGIIGSGGSNVYLLSDSCAYWKKALDSDNGLCACIAGRTSQQSECSGKGSGSTGMGRGKRDKGIRQNRGTRDDGRTKGNGRTKGTRRTRRYHGTGNSDYMERLEWK